MAGPQPHSTGAHHHLPAAPLMHGDVPVLPEVGDRLGVPWGQEAMRSAERVLTLPTSPETHHSPPVPVELAVSKLHELRHGVQAGVEKPVEEDKPDEMVGNLGRQCQVADSPLLPHTHPTGASDTHRQLQETLNDT